MTNDRFTELLTKYLSEQISADELRELEYLLSGDQSLRDRFDYLKAFWKNNPATYNNSEELFTKIKNRISVRQDQPRAVYRRRKRPLYLIGAAAVLLFGIVCLGIYQLMRPASQKIRWQTVGVQPGKKAVITLSDGTKVTINAESSFKYPAIFSGDTRDVYLTGEAFFDVKHDAAHPFIVHTSKMNVRVLGTAFDVKSYNNDSATETTLIRGMIEVTLLDRPSDRIILKPNEKLIVDQVISKTAEKENPEIINKPEGIHNETKYTITSLTYFQKSDSTIVETSWLNDKFVFKDEDFATLCNRLQRWFGVRINIENASFRNYRFTGSFTKENLSEILDILSYAEPFHYKKNNDIVTIY